MSASQKSSNPHAFTLVELLVVIAIIVVLMAMLLPALTQAREQAKRSVCAANLKGRGFAAWTFAADNAGLFPRAWAHALGNPHPAVIEYAQGSHDPSNAVYMQPYVSNPTPDNYWKTFGTDLLTWRIYGVGRGNFPSPFSPPANLSSITYFDLAQGKDLRCPSSEIAMDLNFQNQWWGQFIATQYMYMGGYPAGPAVTPTAGSYVELGTVTIGNGACANSLNHPPAQNTAQDALVRRVLASDVIQSGDGSAATAYSNHGIVIETGGWRPVFFNLLLGDGHVEGNRRDYFPAPLNSTNYSISHWSTAPSPSYFYWGN